MNSVIVFVLGAGSEVNWVGQGGFYSLLRCTAPVFWIFFLMTGLALFTLRLNDSHLERPFPVPLFPIIPLIFCATCAYMIYSGINYAGRLGLVGGLLVVAGLPLYVFSRRSVGSESGLPESSS
jgi:amino acid transporter